MKKILAGITVASVCTAVGAIAYADSMLREITAYQDAAITISVDYQVLNDFVDGDVHPIIYNGKAYFPVTPLAEALGASVEWNEEYHRLEVTSNTRSESSPVRTTFPADTPVSAIFKDYETVASEVLEMYADAISTYDTSKLDRWIRTNVADTKDGEEQIEHTKRAIDAWYSKDNIDRVHDYIDELNKLAVTMNFHEASKYFEYDDRFTLMYFVDTGSRFGYTSKTSVHFRFIKTENSYVLHQVSL